MKTGRRHESLIPLSREHHYGLMVCLRIRRGLETHKKDADWLNQRAGKVIAFFESDLTTHFEAEEEIVFPAMDNIEEARETIEELIQEHRDMGMLVQRLRQTRNLQLFPLLNQFAVLLEAHIRKEERVLFPCYERNVPPEKASQVQIEILNIIGNAMKPKHPVLLE